MISFPPGYLSHIPGSLDPVASPAEDLEIIPGPLVTSPGDWPDMVQDEVMMGIRISLGVGFAGQTEVSLAFIGAAVLFLPLFVFMPKLIQYADITIDCSDGDFENCIGNVMNKLHKFKV